MGWPLKSSCNVSQGLQKFKWINPAPSFAVIRAMSASLFIQSSLCLAPDPKQKEEFEPSYKNPINFTTVPLLRFSLTPGKQGHVVTSPRHHVLLFTAKEDARVYNSGNVIWEAGYLPVWTRLHMHWVYGWPICDASGESRCNPQTHNVGI